MYHGANYFKFLELMAFSTGSIVRWRKLYKQFIQIKIFQSIDFLNLIMCNQESPNIRKFNTFCIIIWKRYVEISLTFNEIDYLVNDLNLYFQIAQVRIKLTHFKLFPDYKVDFNFVFTDYQKQYNKSFVELDVSWKCNNLNPILVHWNHQICSNLAWTYLVVVSVLRMKISCSTSMWFPFQQGFKTLLSQDIIKK